LWYFAEVAELEKTSPQGMSVDVLQENASQDEIQAFNATKRVGRHNAIPVSSVHDD
jgi:hypothetical protein